DPSATSPFASPIPTLLMPSTRPAGAPAAPNREAIWRFRTKLNKFLIDEGAVLTLTSGTIADGGTVFATAAGSQDPKEPLPPPSVALAPEHYNRIARLLEKKIPVTLEFDIDNK